MFSAGHFIRIIPGVSGRWGFPGIQAALDRADTGIYADRSGLFAEFSDNSWLYSFILSCNVEENFSEAGTYSTVKNCGGVFSVQCMAVYIDFFADS